MTIKSGDYVLGIRTADGQRAAIKAAPLSSGEYCVVATTADGQTVAMGLNKMSKSGQCGIIAHTADGKLAGLTGDVVPSVWKLDSDGTLIWSAECGVEAFAVITDGTYVYVLAKATSDATVSTLYKLNADSGSVAWQVNLTFVASCLALSTDLYVGRSDAGTIAVVSVSDGSVSSTITLGVNCTKTTGIVISGGNLFVSGAMGTIDWPSGRCQYVGGKFNTSGTLAFAITNYSSAGVYGSSIAVMDDGRIGIGVANARINVVNGLMAYEALIIATSTGGLSKLPIGTAGFGWSVTTHPEIPQSVTSIANAPATNNTPYGIWFQINNYSVPTPDYAPWDGIWDAGSLYAPVVAMSGTRIGNGCSHCSDNNVVFGARKIDTSSSAWTTLWTFTDGNVLNNCTDSSGNVYMCGTYSG